MFFVCSAAGKSKAKLDKAGYKDTYSYKKLRGKAIEGLFQRMLNCNKLKSKAIEGLLEGPTLESYPRYLCCHGFFKD